MNKIFALQLKPTCFLFSVFWSVYSFAIPALVGDTIPYQTFRDFATNSGQFYPGARNINIYDKRGRPIGVLNKAPMPDFSSVDRPKAVATLFSPQYAFSVAHIPSAYLDYFMYGNGVYYMATRENNFETDFSVIRMNKLVTEVIPVDIIDKNMHVELLSDIQRFPAFYRLGAGSQKVSDNMGNIVPINGAYRFSTGGTMGRPYFDIYDRLIIHSGGVFGAENGPIANHGSPGDSGSPLFAWDAVRSKWVGVGALSMIILSAIEENLYAVISPDFIDRVRQKYSDTPVTNPDNNRLLKWQFNPSTGIGSIGGGYIMHGSKGQDAENAKDLTFSGAGGLILLQDNVNQGSGSLNFDKSYTVIPQQAQTWIGGGVNIARDVTVTWGVNGMAGDNLHKIGEGTLKVNGKGINPGGLKVGDGTVLLAQLPDNEGRRQAFSSVNIASGRPLVMLTDAHQVKPDNIRWGFRGGKLDVYGNSLVFRRLNAEDYGAILTNSSRQRADITLNYQRSLDELPVREWSYSRKGIIGDLYEYNNSNAKTIDYFLLKRENYSWFPIDHHSTEDWEFIGHDRQQAIRKGYERNLENSYIFHGQFSGNLNIHHRMVPDSTGAMILDGAMNISGTFTQENGHLIFQGHPVIHAYNGPGTVEKLRMLGDSSLRTEPVSFHQQDWERRTFLVNNLQLQNAHFDLARNASLNGDIHARYSYITLGSPSLYIDLNDGKGASNILQQGTSIPYRYTEISRYEGNITLAENSSLHIRDKFNGSINGENSQVNITSRNAFLETHSTFHNTPVTLGKRAKLTARGGWKSNSTVSVGPSATLLLATTSVNAKQVMPSFYMMDKGAQFELKEGSTLRISPFVVVSGDIHSTDRAEVYFSGKRRQLADNLTSGQQKIADMTGGYANSWTGNISATGVQLNMKETRWHMRGDPQVGDLRVSQSLIGFATANTAFSTLHVDALRADNSGFVLRTDLKSGDKIVVSKIATGQKNTLFLDFIKTPTGNERLNIPLVVAPVTTNAELFKVSGPVAGFSQLEPVIHTVYDANTAQWVLRGFKFTPNSASVSAARSFLDMGYNQLIAQMNNLNKRMGELRKMQDQEGAWVRIANASGSGKAGYTDSHRHLQLGFDKKRRQSDADLFTGILMSYTDTRASSHNFRGKTDSFGPGIYASTLFDSGAYLDVIGKYIRHNNDYHAYFASLGQRKYPTHSWIAGIEGGYRHHLQSNLFIEPQVELVYGAVSGTMLKWNDNGIDVAMRRKASRSLIGRAGIVTGRTFSSKKWAVTLRAGVDYQYDLQAKGETVLRDVSGEKRFTDKKDGRMLYHAGLNGLIKGKLRFGLELERSAFGNYNVNHAINANVRYMF